MTDLRNDGSVGAADVVGPRRSRPIGIATAVGRAVGTLNIWLWVFVLLPSLVAGVYYFGIASPQYLSEAKFIVRSQSEGSPNILGTLLQGSGLVRSTDDTHSVKDFIMSRDAVAGLVAHSNLVDVFARPEGDFVARFPNFMSGKSFEALYRRYPNFVDTVIDSSTGVSTLRVKAFRPEDAQVVAVALLNESETLINRLNERAENDALQLARSEVQHSEDGLREAQKALTEFRIHSQMLDPKITTTGIYEAVNKLTEARIAAQISLAQLTADSPRSPNIPFLRTQIATLSDEIATANQEATGEVGSVATKTGEYERLALDRELAEKTLTSATASLEQARIEAQRHRLYIEYIVEPNRPDFPMYPLRLVSFAEVVAVCLLTYGISWLLIAGIREHAQP